MTIKSSRCKSKGFWWSSALAILLALGACQPAPQPQAPIAPQLALHKHAHATRYAIDPLRSTMTLRVYRDGPLARFGHNHVIAITQMQGIVYREADLSQSEVELRFPVASMTVDAPDDRAQAGANFPGALPPEAIAGTRQHMLGPQLLGAEQYPQIALQSTAVGGQWPELQLTFDVTVRKLTTRIVLFAHMAETEKMLIAEGSTQLSQSQLGLKPYSVLGGGLRVSDNIDVKFHIVAARE